MSCRAPREAAIEVADVMTQTKWVIAEKKLNDFRRHPDWGRAADRVRQSRGQEFFFLMLPDGRRAMPEEVAAKFIAAVDQEFIDEIVRNGDWPGADRLRDAVALLIRDCEHLLDILEGKAEQAWDYEYQRQRIASARAALAPDDDGGGFT